MTQSRAGADDGRVDHEPSTRAALDASDLVDAARQLRAMVEALPPATARDRATARRIEGAAVALDALADQPPVPPAVDS